VLVSYCQLPEKTVKTVEMYQCPICGKPLDFDPEQYSTIEIKPINW
jgi:hypothetical protein